MNIKAFLFGLMALAPGFALAEVIEEIIVTGSYIESSPPAQRVVRTADNLLLKVLITNDAREEEQRETEVHKTLLRAIEAADKSKSIELSSVGSGGFVVPLRKSNHRIELTNGGRPDTSQAFFRVKGITSALGSDYRVVLTGIDRPVEWAKVGSIDVAIFIPYEYVVVPTSISAFNVFPEY